MEKKVGEKKSTPKKKLDGRTHTHPPTDPVRHVVRYGTCARGNPINPEREPLYITSRLIWSLFFSSSSGFSLCIHTGSVMFGLYTTR